jgi:hypothetical protein
MEDMYKQAILDAKAVRASAMANAKLTLQEAFEPKVQNMIRLKLSEELEDEMTDEPEEEVDEVYSDTEEEMDESSLDDILAELDDLAGKKDEADMSYEYDESDLDETDEEELDEKGDYLQEAEEDESEDESEEESEDEESEEDESEDETEDEESEEDESEDETSDDTKVIDITLGDLKQVIQSVMDQGSDMEDMPNDAELGDDENADVDIDLDEILAELSRSKKAKTEDEMDEARMKQKNTQLQEANKTIKFLQKELNEVNLLNAKLLYMNKIFKSKNLSESQKVSVVSALDRASNVKEAKNVFETLKETLSVSKSQPIRESIGFASKPSGVAQKKNIVESDDFVKRWQVIAGIK